MHETQVDEAAGPQVTVVCNVYNEAPRIPRLLDMLERQRIQDLQVVFVDDGSTDDTRDAIRSYGGSVDVRLIALDHLGLAPARAEGLAAASTGVAVVVDADMEFEPGWLGAICDLFAADPGVGGSFSRVESSGDSPVARGGQAVREVVYWVRNRSNRPWMVGHGMAIRIDAYRALSFTADDLTAEDLDLSERLADAGWRVVPLDEPPIRTVDPATLPGVWRRHLRVGRRTARLVRTHPKFLLRASNAGRFFPVILVGAWLINPKLAVAGEIAMSGVLAWVMRRRGVAGRDIGAGWIVFHVQTSASVAGFVLEMLSLQQAVSDRAMR